MAGSSDKRYDELMEGVMAGRLNRRQVMRRAVLFGLSVPAIGSLLAACGDDDDDDGDDADATATTPSGQAEGTPTEAETDDATATMAGAGTSDASSTSSCAITSNRRMPGTTPDRTARAEGRYPVASHEGSGPCPGRSHRHYSSTSAA